MSIDCVLLCVSQRRDDWCCDGDGLVGTRGVVGPERRALLNRQGARGLQAAELVLAAPGATTSWMASAVLTGDDAAGHGPRVFIQAYIYPKYLDTIHTPSTCNWSTPKYLYSKCP